MIKKFFGTFLLFLISSIIPVRADASSFTADFQPAVEFRVGAFFPTSRLFRKIYGNCGVCYEVEVSTRIPYACMNNFEIWANYDYFYNNGKIDGYCCGKSRINIHNFSLGFNYNYPFCNCFEAYVGLGGSVSRVHLKNNSFCDDSKAHAWAGGLVVKSGIIYNISCNWFVDLFVDYLYQPVKFHNHDHYCYDHHNHRTEISAVKVGGGIGFKF